MECSLLSGDGRVVLRYSALWFQVNIILQKTHNLLHWCPYTNLLIYYWYMVCFDTSCINVACYFYSHYHYTSNTFVVAVIVSVVYNIIIPLTITIITTRASERHQFWGKATLLSKMRVIVSSAAAHLWHCIHVNTYIHEYKHGLKIIYI